MKEGTVLELYLHVFGTIDNLTRFAETKNAALIGFNSALIFAFLSAIKDIAQLKFKKWTFSLFGLVIVCQIISMSIAFYSMIPKKEVSEYTNSIPPKNLNLTFFGHIAKCNHDTYYNLTRLNYHLRSTNESLEKNIAYNIVQISIITDRKFSLFNKAIVFDIITVLLVSLWFFGFVYLTFRTNGSKYISADQGKNIVTPEAVSVEKMAGH